MINYSKHYHLERFNKIDTIGVYNMPVVFGKDIAISSILPFNYAKSSASYTSTIHFYIDDYQFERIWSNPDKYIPILKKYNGIIGPDFSTYGDFPLAVQIFNIWKNRMMEYIFQSAGIEVVPNFSYMGENSEKWCFDGIIEGSCIATSTSGVSNECYNITHLNRGIEAALDIIKPPKIYLYGLIKYVYEKHLKYITKLDSFWETQFLRRRNEKR
jgi:hypothetical protein